MDAHFDYFKNSYYNYPLLRKRFEFGHCLFELDYLRAEITQTTTLNEVSASLKDIIFARTQAYNLVQVFQFVVTNMEGFYERRLLGIAHKHPGHLRVANRFLRSGWEGVNVNYIKKQV